MSTLPADSNAKEPSWWLSTCGKAEGPHSSSYVLTGLKANNIPPTAYACPVGGTEWKLIQQWPAFASATPPPHPPIETLSGPHWETPLTNSRLPIVANWICIYCIVVAPAVWVASGLSNVMVGWAFKEESPLFGFEILTTFLIGIISLVATILLVIGGLRLRALRSSGALIIKVSILTNFVFGLLGFVVMVSLHVVATDADSSTSTPGSEVISFFMLMVALATLTFEIVAVIWLLRNSKMLPLTNA